MRPDYNFQKSSFSKLIICKEAERIWLDMGVMLTLAVLLFAFIQNVKSYVNSEIRLVQTFSVPDLTGLGHPACKQLELGPLRLYCLSEDNVIHSWFKNGSGYVNNSLMVVSPWTQKIQEFSLSTDFTEIVYSQKLTKKVIVLNANTLVTKQVRVTLAANAITSVIKISNRFLLTVLNTSVTVQNDLSSLSLIGTSVNTIIYNNMSGQIKMRMSQNEIYLFLWNDRGAYTALRMIPGAGAVNGGLIPNATLNLNLMTKTRPSFSPDGSRVVADFDNLQPLVIHNLWAASISSRVFKNFTYVIEKVEWFQDNHTLAIFHNSTISFYSVSSTDMTLIYQQDYGVTFTKTMVFDYAEKKIYMYNNELIEVYQIGCITGYDLRKETRLHCQIPQTTPYESLQEITAGTLQQESVQSLNQIPGYRRLFRPISVFFSNFDDLWLYNYIDHEFDQAVQSTFDIVQQLEQQKWEFLHFETIWQDWLGFQFTKVESQLNNTQRLAFTSPRFLKIEGSANGFILNTLQFFLSNFFFLLLIWLIGHLLFRLSSRFNFKIKDLFRQFQFSLTIPLMCLDGNLQYMFYLMGFQLDTLWQVSFKEKMQSIFLVFCLFGLVFICLTIYFFFKLTYQQKANEFFQNCSPDLRGIVYFKSTTGIRNLILGFVHYFCQAGDTLVKKISILLFVQLSFLVWTIYLIARRKFFIKKSRQWIITIISLLRAFMVFLFILDSLIKQSLLTKYKYLQSSYSITMSIYIGSCIILVIYELSGLLQHLVGFLRSLKAVKIKSKDQLEQIIEPKNIQVAQIKIPKSGIRKLRLRVKNKIKKCLKTSLIISKKQLNIASKAGNIFCQDTVDQAILNRKKIKLKLKDKRRIQAKQNQLVQETTQINKNQELI